MDSANTTVLSFDPFPPPEDLSIYPNASSKRQQNMKVVALGTVSRPEAKPLVPAPVAAPPPPPSPPRSPPAPPAIDRFKPSERGWGFLLLGHIYACCCAWLAAFVMRHQSVIHHPAPPPAGFYAYNEDDIAYALTVPNIVVGLKSHVVPTGKVQSDTSLFPYVQFPITIGKREQMFQLPCGLGSNSLCLQQSSWLQRCPQPCLGPRPAQSACARTPKAWGRTGAASAPSMRSVCGRFSTLCPVAAAAMEAST